MPRDEPVPEAAIPGRHPADAHQPEPDAWDALDGVHPAVGDAADLRWAPADADAEKLAVPARDDPALDAWFLLERLSVPQERSAWAAAPYTPDAVQSAEQSCAALAGPELLEVREDAVPQLEAEA